MKATCPSTIGGLYPCLFMMAITFLHAHAGAAFLACFLKFRSMSPMFCRLLFLITMFCRTKVLTAGGSSAITGSNELTMKRLYSPLRKWGE